MTSDEEIEWVFKNFKPSTWPAPTPASTKPTPAPVAPVQPECFEPEPVDEPVDQATDPAPPIAPDAPSGSAQRRARNSNSDRHRRPQLRLRVSSQTYERWHDQSRSVELLLRLSDLHGLTPEVLLEIRKELHNCRRLLEADNCDGTGVSTAFALALAKLLHLG